MLTKAIKEQKCERRREKKLVKENKIQQNIRNAFGYMFAENEKYYYARLAYRC